MATFFGGYRLQRAAAAMALATTGLRILGPPGPSLEPIPVGDMHLSLVSSISEPAELRSFAHQGLKTVSLGQLPLDQSYTYGVDRGGGAKIPRTPTQLPTTGFTWSATDSRTPDWFPQSVSSSDDAHPATGLIDGRKWLAVAWRSGGSLGDNQQSRVSFVDLTHPTDPAKARYRNVLLVKPRSVPAGSSEAPYVPIPSHASGLVWSGNHLLMAEGGVIHVFDTTKILKTADGQYVLPRVGEYLAPGPATRVQGDVSWISGMSLDLLDPAHPKLLTQEWTPEPGGRITSYTIDPKTGLLATDANGDAKVTAAWRMPYVTNAAGILDAGVDESGHQQFLTSVMGNPSSTLVELSTGGPAVALDRLPADSQQLSQIPNASHADTDENVVAWDVNEPVNKRSAFQERVPGTPLPSGPDLPEGVLPTPPRVRRSDEE